jgi:hypothetical protein
MPDDRPALPRTAPSARPDEAVRAHLRYIRETMGRTATFTAVPGWGGVAMGAVGLGAAVYGGQQEAVLPWLRVWLTAAVVAAGVGGWATWRKAQAGGVPVLSGAGRKFILGLAPALAAGAVLTLAVAALDAGPTGPGLAEPVARSASAVFQLMPGLWLLLYGAGVAAAGTFSVRPIPLLGGLCMAAGAAALLAPAAWGDFLLGLGFGVFQIGVGLFLARRYGG